MKKQLLALLALCIAAAPASAADRLAGIIEAERTK